MDIGAQRLSRRTSLWEHGIDRFSLSIRQIIAVAERPRQHVRLTPMLSVMIGVVTALIIVAVIVMVVLRIQHTHVEDQNKSQMEDHAKQTKAMPIQRELRFREGCSLLADEKHPSSPFRKLDTSGDLSESDEKNPDIIPQQIAGPYNFR